MCCLSKSGLLYKGQGGGRLHCLLNEVEMLYDSFMRSSPHKVVVYIASTVVYCTYMLQNRLYCVMSGGSFV